MKISFFGSSLMSSYWNGAATYYRGLIRELHRRGHHVTFHEPNAYGRQENRDIDPPDWAEVIVYENSPDAALREIERAGSADLIIKASGVGVFDELLEAELLHARRPEQLAVFWDVDAPATLERLAATPGDPLLTLIPKFDAVLTYGGGDRVVRAYRALGARSCTPIYNGVDPRTHFRVTRDPAFAADLSFLANRLPDREERVDEFFFQAAANLPSRQFLLAGNGWESRAMPPNVRSIGHLGTAEHNVFNSSGGAVLNIARSSMARFGFSPATRIFEAAGAAACIITDEWEGISEFFSPGSEILVAANGDEVAEIISALTPARAREIGAAARRRVLASHTYAARVDLFESLFLPASV